MILQAQAPQAHAAGTAVMISEALDLLYNKLRTCDTWP